VETAPCSEHRGGGQLALRTVYARHLDLLLGIGGPLHSYAAHSLRNRAVDNWARRPAAAWLSRNNRRQTVTNPGAVGILRTAPSHAYFDSGSCAVAGSAP
jgi:hypothetical protein